jgi:arylsulfatase A-like enzyme
MKRRSILFLLTFLLGSIMLAGCNRTQNSIQQVTEPNIIFIVTDDLGWSDLGCYGADLHETPNIDRLAEKSMIFTNSYSAGPVCSPTRASLMTGKTPAKLNYTIWSEAAGENAEGKRGRNSKYLEPLTLENLPLEETTIAEVLRQKDYLTAHVGKWHIGDYMHFPNTQGFDVSVASSQRGAPPTFFYPYTGIVYDEFRFVGDLGMDANGKYFTDREGEYLTDRLTDEAMKMIEDAGSRPFFLNLSYYNVHVPLEAKSEDIAYFKNKLSPELHHQNETYAAMVKNVDDNVGRLLKKLDDQGIAENTIVIFTSDNGGFIQEYDGISVTDNFPLRDGKGSLYEGGIRIPTMIYYPKNPGNGRKIDIPISTIDYLPTVMDIAGIPNDLEDIEGISFLPLLEGKEAKTLEERALFWHFPHNYYETRPVSAMRDGNWKLLEYLEDGHIELYNLSDDIGEGNNLANTDPQKAEELLGKLHRWKTDAGAKELRLNPDYKKR